MMEIRAHGRRRMNAHLLSINLVRHAFVAVVAIALTASLSFADPITWNLGGSTNAGSMGNVRTYTVGGVTVTATAWGYTYGSSDYALQQGALARWSNGVGVCNQSEGTSCSDPNSQVDNVGPDDWVLFTFSQAIDPSHITIDPNSSWDRDSSYWAGYVDPAYFSPSTGTLNLTGSDYSDLTAVFGARTDTLSTQGTNPLDVTINNSGLVNTIIFGALPGEYSGSSIDRFRIASITGSLPGMPAGGQVPEPASLLLLGSGVSALLLLRRVRTPKPPTSGM